MASVFGSGRVGSIRALLSAGRQELLDAAFDRLLLGVHPSYVIHVLRDILEEADGPMLRHGLQGLDSQRIYVPSRRVERPDEGRLAARFGESFGKLIVWFTQQLEINPVLSCNLWFLSQPKPLTRMLPKDSRSELADCIDEMAP